MRGCSLKSKKDVDEGLGEWEFTIGKNSLEMALIDFYKAENVKLFVEEAMKTWRVKVTHAN